MAQLIGLDNVTFHLALLEARRRQEQQERSLAPVKGIVVGVTVGLAAWSALLLCWFLIA